MKPGWKTSEFWLSFAAMLVGALMASGLLDVIKGDTDDKIVGMIAMVLASLGYNASRGFTKAAAAKTEAVAAMVTKDPR